MLALLAAIILAAPSSPCQPRIFSCLPSSSKKLECFCSGTPQPSSIQNILEEVSDNLQETTSELTVRSCAEEHHSVRLDLGQKQVSQDLEVHNKLEKYVLKNFGSLTLHLSGEIYKNMTIKFEDVTGDLEVKANVDFMQFPENLFFTATPSVRTVLRLVFINVKSIQLSSFVVKNYDNKSEISFESKDAEIFAVQRLKFPWVENKVFANSCRSEYGEVPCSQVFQHREAGPDSSMVVMMAIIIAITVVAMLVICWKDGFRGVQGKSAAIDMGLHRTQN